MRRRFPAAFASWAGPAKRMSGCCVALLFGLFLNSCVPRQTFEREAVSAPARESYLAGRPHELRQDYLRLLEEGERNRVLNNLRLGLDALQFGLVEEAERAFSASTQAIDALYANAPDAAKARSLWYEEGQKEFKGEPYERTMAFFYFGLMDLFKEDYENARASFKSAILQDAFAEEEQNRCDFALPIFMSGWVSEKNGDLDLAQTAFAEVKSLRRDFNPPVGMNSLIILETGASPRKVADGPGHAELKFRRGRNFTDESALVAIDGGAYRKVYLLDDLFWQASSRGGRPVDKIIKGKATFRNSNAAISSDLSSVSDTLMLSGAALSSTPGLTYAGAAIGLVSVTQMALAARTRAYADVRYWDNLSDKIHILPLNLGEGVHMISIVFIDGVGQPLPELNRTFRVRAGAQGAQPIWVPSRQRLSLGL